MLTLATYKLASALSKIWRKSAIGIVFMTFGSGCDARNGREAGTFVEDDQAGGLRPGGSPLRPVRLPDCRWVRQTDLIAILQ